MGFIDLFTVKTKSRRKSKAVSTEGYISLGSDGSFFKDMDAAFLNSPTGTMVYLKFIEHCTFDNIEDYYVPIWRKIRSDYFKYGYFLLLVEYDIDGKVTAVFYRNPKKYVVKDFDDNDNASTFKNIASGKVYPTFNPNKEVLKAQFEKEGFEKFSGQIYMYNDSPLAYRITPLFSVLRDMQFEANASVYKEKANENAFFGNNIFVVKEPSNPTDRDTQIINDLRGVLKGSKGVEEASQNVLLTAKGDIEDVSKLLYKVSISNDIDIDLMEKSKDSASDTICMAAYCFPTILANKSEGIFGNSGEAIQVAMNIWKETCKTEAEKIYSAFQEIGIEILKPEVQNDDTNNTAD